MSEKYFSYDGVSDKVEFHETLGEAKERAIYVADMQYQIASSEGFLDDDDKIRICESCYGIALGGVEIAETPMSEDEQQEYFDQHGDCCEKIYDPPKLIEYPQNNGWIKCSERLPEIDSIVFGGYFIKDEFISDKFVRCIDSNEWYWCHVVGDEWRLDDDYPVTHWQPLPKMPES